MFFRLRRTLFFNRMMHVYWRLQRAMTLGVRGVVFDDQGRVLLIKHSYADGWHFPGGGVEPGEALIEALKRELHEEANVELTGPPELHGVFFQTAYSNRDHVAVYVIRQFRQTATPVPNSEIVEHGFFPMDALPRDTTKGTRARLAEIVNGAPKPQHW
jgi:8-oxo-dGTP pyrophosphatase MutT (NUDIX family)